MDDDLLAEKIPLTDVCQNDLLIKISKTLETEKSKIVDSPTGKLWLQYMTMVDLLRSFIKAENVAVF